MKAGDFSRRFAQFEASLEGLVGKQWSQEELITAMVSGSASLLQMSQVFDLVEEDIRTTIMLYAVSARHRREVGGKRRVDPLFPVDVAAEIISYPPECPLPSWDIYVPEYDPTGWAMVPRPNALQTWAPHEFAWWARDFLMRRLLGTDGGMGLRRSHDRWWKGGGPPINPDRYPHESVYWLLEPIDTVATIFDQRLLRRPTNELFWRIGTYDRFDTPEDGHEWT